MSQKNCLHRAASIMFAVWIGLILAACAKALSEPTSAPVINPEYILNFEDEAARIGWQAGSPGGDARELQNIKDGKYLFEYASGFLENQSLHFANVQMAVDVEFLVQSPVEAGVACRMQPGGAGRYSFSISNSGQWRIVKTNGGETVLAQGRSDAVRPDKNRLAARCEGSQLTLLVNDVEIGSAHDGELTSGGLNLSYAAAAPGAGTFDNITVEDLGGAPALAAPPAAPLDEILYAENFDDPNDLAGWDAKLDGKSQANPQDGAFRLSVDGGMAAFIQRQQNFADAVIEVDAQFLGPDPARMGLLCRNEAGNYGFTLSNTGEWRIESGGKTLADGLASLQPGVNHLAVSCVGDRLSFALNGAALGAAQDGAFRHGQIGLMLDSGGKSEVLFDNLTVRRPPAQAEEAAPPQASPTQTPAATAAPTLTPTPAATLRPTAIPEDELTLYQTEFEETGPTLADWKTFAYSMDKKAFVTEGYETFTSNGFFRFQQDANIRTFAIYDKELSTADVDLFLRGSAPFEGNGGLGLVCRYSQAGWYQFMVESHGQWNIRLVKPDESGQYHFYIISSASVPKWLRQNVELRAECKGDRLTFYIDGEKMASVHDSTFPTGSAGILGWSFTHSDEWNMIDRFSIRRAQWSETGLPGPAPTPGADGTIYNTDFARLDDLKPYWVKVDLGIQDVPGSPLLVGGPGHAAPQTYQYINDFDPGPDVEISADVRGALNWPRGLICRYSEDGWYETFYMKDDQSHSRVGLALGQRDEKGHLARYIIDTYYPPAADSQVNLALICAGNRISVKLNGKQVLYTEDNTWQTGRYGLLFTDNSPVNLRGALLNYTVRRAQPILEGTIIRENEFNSPEEIAEYLGVDLQGNPMVKMEQNALVLDADNGIGLSSSGGIFENSEISMDVEFMDNGTLYLQCRSEGNERTVYEVRSNGEWFFHWRDQEIARGSSPAIQPGKNTLTMRCEAEHLTLTANGQTVAEETYPLEYSPIKGRIVLWVNAKLRVNRLAVKILQGSFDPQTASLLRNQVFLPPVYQPGETIYGWNLNSILFGCNSGWWGRDSNPCLWTRSYRQEDRERSLKDGQILVKGYDRYLTLFTYQPDLYDLPVEIGASTAFTSKGGGIALFCRATASGRYEFYIQPDGKWYIRRNVVAEFYLPQAKHLTVLAHGTAENFPPQTAQLSAVCSGSNLIFYLNGAELGRIQDTLFPEGQAGIFFDAYTEGSFTNLFIKRAK